MSNVDYRDYILDAPVRHENIEWSIDYAYNVKDETSPRVLLIGDSICNGYQRIVRALLADKVNVSFWASSRCVTEKPYLRILDQILDVRPYDLVLFNNGCHNLGKVEYWEPCYRSVLRFIADKLPHVKIGIVLATPNRREGITNAMKDLNKIATAIAEEKGYPVIDLFTPMDALDRGIENWLDDFHFSEKCIQMQADIVSRAVIDILGVTEGNIVQLGSEMGPDGALR